MVFVRDGDTVAVHSMERLARNLDDLRRIVKKLTEGRVGIEFVKEGLSFNGGDSPMANRMLSVMGAFAEFERALRRPTMAEIGYRTDVFSLDGIAVASANTFFGC